MKDPRKVKWVNYVIVVPTEDDKKQLQAAFEYFHDNDEIDTDFIAVNQIAHTYIDETLDPKHPILIIVNPELFKTIYDTANPVLPGK